MQDYWAHSAQNEHSADSREGWQRLSDHLRQVAAIAGKLASGARPGDSMLRADAELSGLLHDFGKYTNCFQRMLAEGRGKCQHAIHGAMLAYTDESLRARRLPVAWAIAGHHSGLPDKWDLIDRRLQGSDSDFKKFSDEVHAIFDNACRDLLGLKEALAMDAGSAGVMPALRLDLYARMLFSCLVDADRLDSAGRPARQEHLDAAGKLEKLLHHLSELCHRSPAGVVTQMRAQVLADCLAAAELPQNLFSLSVPTGGGKTLASMAFALRRAARYPERFRRVIVVIPFLSIIEQNADVYARVFGPEALLEHHSGSLMKLTVKDPGLLDGEASQPFVPAEDDNGDEQEFQASGNRFETENWDAPLIVTTSVRFFESLFSNRPKDLRRVHNIARSIVILDEVQTLPRGLVGPLLGMMKELADDWGVNFIFSTATQPAFQSANGRNPLMWAPGTLQEIVGDAEPLRKALKRAEISWELNSAVNWAQVAERALEAVQSLSIVNLKDHALKLFDALKIAAADRQVKPTGLFHLSTRMCAAHRLRVIDSIRTRLKNNQPCHVVSTQLVEAGVDLDFPLVLRALAPLDSIVQAAGRADREGKLTAKLGRPGGRVVVFLPEDDRTPPNEYREATALTRVLCHERQGVDESIQVDDPHALSDFFRRYYGQEPEQLGKRLVEFRNKHKCKTLADEFEMISNRTKDVYVPHDAPSQLWIDRLETEFRAKRHFTSVIRGIVQHLRRSVVGLGPWEFEKAKASGVIAEVVKDSDIWVATPHAYKECLGLLLEFAPEDLVISEKRGMG